MLLGYFCFSVFYNIFLNSFSILRNIIYMYILMFIFLCSCIFSYTFLVYSSVYYLSIMIFPLKVCVEYFTYISLALKYINYLGGGVWAKLTHIFL